MLDQEKKMTKRGGTPRRLRSAYLAEWDEFADPPFRQNFLMRFPPKDRNALKLLAKLLFFKEDFEGDYFPVLGGSHNLVHLQAAAMDMLSIARSLAYLAKEAIDEDLSQREVEAAKLADRYAVKAARLAEEILAARDKLAPRRARRSRTAAQESPPLADPIEEGAR
jgi:hypothetical protein